MRIKIIDYNKLRLTYLLFVSIFLLTACTKETTGQKDEEDILLSKNYNEVCFLMTHNAMNNSEKGYLIPNQTHSITKQLQNGVHGLMIDTYDGSNDIAQTYHGVAFMGSQNLVDVLQEVKDYLVSNPKKIVSIIFENNGSNTQLEKAIDSIGLNTFTYIHTNGTTWPTLQEMVDNNTRLVLFVEQDKQPRASYLMYAWGTIFDTKYTYKNVSEFDTDVNRGGSGSKELYLVNHWLSNGLGLPDKNLAPQANKHEVVSKRVQDCATTNNHFINFLGVDFYEIGDVKIVVDSINGIN
ncbi:MAG: phosphatidylinositol-specific phospholipase C domain-containing protein [Bacteroidetes bacterium]|nr:phosphatidylinositol-specific phospholipase C domain-containing protein [Bacteroidota bacterium]